MSKDWDRRFKVLTILFIFALLMSILQVVFHQTEAQINKAILLIIFVFIVDIKMRLK